LKDVYGSYDYLSNSTIAYNTSSAIIRNTTMVEYSKLLVAGYIGPSITPLTSNNAGWVLFEIDAVTFSVVNSQIYLANLLAANYGLHSCRNSSTILEPSDINSAWPSNSPLDGAFWHGVKENMLANNSLVEVYNL
jgi:sphingomyelin phosphodiesterase